MGCVKKGPQSNLITKEKLAYHFFDLEQRKLYAVMLYILPNFSSIQMKNVVEYRFFSLAAHTKNHNNKKVN